MALSNWFCLKSATVSAFIKHYEKSGWGSYSLQEHGLENKRYYYCNNAVKDDILKNKLN